MTKEDLYRVIAATKDVENTTLRETLKYLIALPCATHADPTKCACCLAAWQVMTGVLQHLDGEKS